MARTITLKINEKSSFGKTILDLVDIAVRENKGVEVVNKPNTETLKAIRNAEKGDAEKISLDEFRKELYS